jgi:hypothetical protein
MVPHLIQKPEGFASLTWHFKDQQPVAVELGGIYASIYASLYGTASSNIEKKSIRKSMDVSYSKVIEQMD